MSDNAIFGCLAGTAIGDALGLPYEGLSPRRAKRILGSPTRYRFLFGHGMISDDTEQTLIVVESLIESAGDPAKFEKIFARKLKWWFLALPAGIGMATAKACCKLLAGIPGPKAGVFSAGNGAAMRTAIIGVYASDREQLCQLVHVSTRITHTDPKAEWGALTVAVAAYCAKSGQITEPDQFLSLLRQCLQTAEADEFIRRIVDAVDHVRSGGDTVEFALQSGLAKGVGGYVYHCLPIVIHCWLSHQNDLRTALETIVACGGDTDTNAAMAGAIIGSRGNSQTLPAELHNRLILFPTSFSAMKRLSRQLDRVRQSGEPEIPASTSWIASFLRNLVFLLIVLVHGFRRLAPPY